MGLLWRQKEEVDVSWGKERAAEGVGSIMLWRGYMVEIRGLWWRPYLLK